MSLALPAAWVVTCTACGCTVTCQATDPQAHVDPSKPDPSFAHGGERGASAGIARAEREGEAPRAKSRGLRSPWIEGERGASAGIARAEREGEAAERCGALGTKRRGWLPAAAAGRGTFTRFQISSRAHSERPLRSPPLRTPKPGAQRPQIRRQGGRSAAGRSLHHRRRAPEQRGDQEHSQGAGEDRR